MTVHSITEAAKLTQNQKLIGVAEAVITTDQSLQFMPTWETDRAVLDFNYEATLPAGAFMAVGDDFADEAPTNTNVTRTLRTLGVQLPLPVKIDSLYSNPEQQKAFLITKGAKGLGQTLANALVNGDNSGNNIEGWDAMVTSGQKISSVGALDFSDLDALMNEKLKVANGNVAFVCNAKVKAKILGLLRTAGGLSYMDLAGTTMRVPHYNGIPVLQNDYIAGTTGSTGQLYLINFDRDQGVSTAFGVSAVAKDEIGGVGPFHVLNAGYHNTKHYELLRVFCEVAQICRSPLSIARAEDITV
jgi:HK97 family phage major capsid protein